MLRTGFGSRQLRRIHKYTGETALLLERDRTLNFCPPVLIAVRLFSMQMKPCCNSVRLFLSELTMTSVMRARKSLSAGERDREEKMNNEKSESCQ